MLLAPRGGWWPALVAVGMGLAVPARAGDGGLRDDAGVFTEDARARAGRKIDALRQDNGKDLLVETLVRLPDEQADEVRKARRPRERKRLFRAIAEERAAAAGVDGVYVLLCKDPADHAVVVRPEENDFLLPFEERERVDRLFGSIRSSHFARDHDATLLEGIALIDGALHANLRARAAAPVRDGFHWSAALWVAGALMGLWLVVNVLRARAAVRQGTPSAVLSGADVSSVMSGPAAGFWLLRALLAAPTVPEPAKDLPAPEVAAEAPAEPRPFAADDPYAPNDLEPTAPYDQP